MQEYKKYLLSIFYTSIRALDHALKTQWLWISNILLLLTVNVLIKPIWIFGIDRQVQNNVGAAQYGIYFATFNFTVLLYILLDMGISSYNARRIARQPDLLDHSWGSILGIKTLLSLVYIGACVLGAWWLQYDTLQQQLLIYLGANQILIGYIAYFRSNLQGLHQFRTDTFLSVLDRLLAIVFCGALLYGLLGEHLRIIEYAQYQTLSYTLSAILAFYLVQRQLKKPNYRFDAQLLRSIVRQTLPFALMVLLMSIYTRIDAILLSALLPDGDIQSGIYASAYRLLDALNMIGSLAATQLLPIFTRRHQQTTQLHRLFGVCIAAAFVGSTSIAAVCWIERQSIMSYLYHAASPYYADVFGGLMWSFIPISLIYVVGTLWTAIGNMRLINWVVGFGVVVNVALNLILIPPYKALGAAWASVGAQSFIAIAFICAYCLRKTKI